MFSWRTLALGLALILFIGVPQRLLAQNRNHLTTEIDLMLKDAQGMQGTRPDSAWALYCKALQKARELDYLKGEGDALNQLAWYYLRGGRWIESVSSFNQIFNLPDPGPDVALLAEGYTGLAEIFYRTGQYALAMDYYMQALSLYVELDDVLAQAGIHHAAALAYRAMQQQEIALSHLLRSFDLYQQLAQDQLKAAVILDLATTYQSLGAVDSAHSYFQKVHDLSWVISDTCLSIQAYIGQIELSLQQEDWIIAENLIRQAQENSSTTRQYAWLARIMELKGDLHMQKQQPEQAFLQYHQALQNLHAQQQPLHQARLQEKLAGLHLQQNRPMSAFLMLQESTRLQDSIMLAENHQQLLGRQLSYQQQFSQDTLSLLQKEEQLAQLVFKRQKLYRLSFALILIFLISLVSSWVFYLQRKHATRRKLIMKSKEILRYNQELDQKNQILEVQKKEISQQNEQLQANYDRMEAYRAELEKLTNLASFTGNAIIMTDLEGNFEWINAGFTRLFGYTFSQLQQLGKNIRDVSSHQQIDKILDHCIQTGKSQSYESQFQTHTNQTKWLITTITPYFDATGDLQKFIIVESDITRQKLAEQRLKELNANLDERVNQEVAKNRQHDVLLLQQSRHAAMGEMISNIAHQWRQPLSGLSIIIQNIEDAFEYGELDQDYLKKNVSRMMDLILYMSQTIDDFRNFFQADKNRKKFCINEIVSKAVSFMEPAYKSHHVEIDLHMPFQVFCVGYPNEYVQVVINILNNAKDVFLERKTTNPRVCIRLEKVKEKSVLYITDNAGGIENEVITHVFEPYFSTKSHTNGTGLGLYMSCNIIEKNMKGKLLVKNAEQGAEFAIVV